MAPPTRPVDDATIETEWGQATHDYTFAPAGCTVAGAAVEMLGSAALKTLPLDTAGDDPGGYLDAANDRVEIPTDGEGLYAVALRCNTVGGAATDRTRVHLQVNGSDVAMATEDQAGGTNIPFGISTHLTLIATDLVTVRAQQIGSGTRADVSVQELSIVRLGAEYGGP